MPGIVGFSAGDIRESERRKHLERMQEAITHSDRCVQDSLFCDEHVCATRSYVSVIQNKPQPYHEEGVYVWLDGEFYNQRDLGQRCGRKTEADPELLISLFKNGRDFSFLSQVDGIYSAAVYDSNLKKLHLVTDRYGFRHLNWTVCNGHLAWASELKAMLALPGFQPKLDRRSVEEFLGIGWLLDNSTWFEGVQLLPAATVLTWDIETKSISKHRYWWWDQVAPLPGKIACAELREELRRLFMSAVARRCKPTERVALALSGGLDSRAILAAMPRRGDTIRAITFGKRNCDDVRVAAMAAKVKGAVHDIVEINHTNWLAPRIDAIWWTDGRKDLRHMAIIAAYEKARGVADFVFDGMGGGEWDDDSLEFSEDDPVRYLEKGFSGDIRSSERLLARFRAYAAECLSPGVLMYALFVDSRMRSFTINGPKLATFLDMEYRLPFIDNKYLEFLYSIRRANDVLGHTFWSSLFPDYFKDIPWQKTGVPVGWPAASRITIRFLKRIRNKLLRDTRGFGLRRFYTYDSADYPTWIREEPATSFFEKTFRNPSALYPEYISRKLVQNTWASHLSGKNRSAEVCRYLTFEVWLQQVYEKKYRSGIGA